MAASSGLAEYEVDINGITHTFQLDKEAADRLPKSANPRRKRAVDLAEPTGLSTAENSGTRTGTENKAVDNTPTPEQRQQAAARSGNDVAPEQVQADQRDVKPETTRRRTARKTATTRKARGSSDVENKSRTTSETETK